MSASTETYPPQGLTALQKGPLDRPRDARVASTPIELVPHRYGILHLPHDERGEISRAKLTKLFLKTLKDWKELVNDRIGSLRLRAQQATQNRGALIAELNQDCLMKDGYLELLSHFQTSIQTDPLPTRHIIAYTDEHGLVQGFADHEVLQTKNKTQTVFIHALFTAPWNLKMLSPVQETHKHLVTRGIGTSLIRDVYQFAQSIHAESITLKPLGISETFYRDRLHMREVPDEQHSGICFVMPVTSRIPQELEAHV